MRGVAAGTGPAVILVTGCGRSGTLYIARVLQRLGLDVGHERLGRDGIVSSLWAVTDSKYPPYHQQGPYPMFNIVLHQVREPLATIGSLTTAQPISWDWTCKHIDVDRGAPVLRRAAEYWLRWNELCEHQAAYTYRIESLNEVWEMWMGYVRSTNSLLAEQAATAILDGLSTDVHHREHRAVTWEDVEAATPLYRDIKELARHYGYRAS
jgi:hypothetical protein